MKILGIYDNDINKKLVTYALSLFEHCTTNTLNLSNNFSTKDINTITQHIDLIVLSLDNYSSFTTNSFPHHIPLFFISTKNITPEINTQFNNQNHSILDTYFFTNFDKEFDPIIPTIPNVGLRLKLIRKINYILYKKLDLKDINRFTCGIDRPSIERGDENSY